MAVTKKSIDKLINSFLKNQVTNESLKIFYESHMEDIEKSDVKLFHYFRLKIRKIKANIDDNKETEKTISIKNIKIDIDDTLEFIYPIPETNSADETVTNISIRTICNKFKIPFRLINLNFREYKNGNFLLQKKDINSMNLYIKEWLKRKDITKKKRRNKKPNNFGKIKKSTIFKDNIIFKGGIKFIKTPMGGQKR